MTTILLERGKINMDENDLVQYGSIDAMTSQTAHEATQLRFMRLDAEQAYNDLLEALERVTQNQAWALPRLHGNGELSTRGSILEIVQHVATCKIMYASAAFRKGSYSWDMCFARIREIGSDWKETLAFLSESQDYWMNSWEEIDGTDLGAPRMTNWGAQWPTWRIISTISHHDSYHAGQIALLRALLAPTDVPASTAADYSLASLKLQF